jgi:AraC family transcriptional regulator, arabinose operon regulatory protein
MRHHDVHPPVHAGMGHHDAPIEYRLSAPVLGFQGLALSYTRYGRAYFRVGKEEVEARKYDLFLLRPMEQVIEYGTRGQEVKWGTIWTHFDPRPDWLSWMDWPQVLPGVMRLRLTEGGQRKRILRRFKRVVRIALTAQAFGNELAIHALEGLLLECRRANPNERHVMLDERVQRVVDYLCREFDKPVTLTKLAQIASLSASHLEEVFKAQVGLTPFGFLESQRMRRASHLLHRTSKPVAEVAREVGFEDALYFSKRFRKTFSMSPREYRKRCWEKRMSDV